jgi:hypothetical protein
MILSLAWKEYREQRTVWLLLLALSLLAAYAVVQLFGIANARADDLVVTNAVLLLATAVIYGVVCASLLLAGEVEAGMQPFLHRHAGWRFRLWFGKLLVGAVFCAAFGLVLAGAWGWIEPRTTGVPPVMWFMVLPVVAMEAFAWGMLGGALMRTTMAAAIVSAVFVLIAWLLFGMGGGHFELVLLGRVTLLTLALVLSAAIYCDRDLSRLLAGGILERRLAGNRTPGGWLSLFWLTFRQTRWHMLVLGLLGLAVGLALPWIGVAGWGAYSVVLGVTFGVGLFAGDQPTGRVFLGERRLPPHRVWLAKMLFAAVFLAAITALIVGVAAVHEELAKKLSTANASDPTRGRLPLGILSHDVSPTVFAAYWLVYGFGVGQLFSFLFRKGLVALVLALMLGCLLPFVWVPSLIAGGVRLWQLFLPLVPLFLATGLTMRAWLGDRLAARGPAFAVAGCAVLSLLLTAAAVGYRAVEIPDVGATFDVDAFRSQLSRERTGKVTDAFKEAIREFKARRTDYWAEAPKPQGAPAARFDEQAAEQQHRVSEQLFAVAQDGARVKPELANYLDKMFGDKWVASLEEALGLPPEMLENPNTLGWLPQLEAWTLFDMASHLRARAVQLQDRGDQAGTVHHLRSLFRLARALRYRAGLEGFSAGQSIERLALTGLAAWLRQPDPPPAGLLRSLLTFLGEEEPLRPSLRETLRVEAVAEQNLLREPAYLRLQFDPLAQLSPSKAEEYLAMLVAQIPWEKERLRRRVNRFGRRLEQAPELKFPIEPPFGRRDPKIEADQLAAVREDIEQNGNRFQVRTAQRLSFDDKVDLCRLRAARIQLALVLYQLDQGKAAPTLATLVPRYLEALPQDPYSGQDFRYRVSDGEGLPGEAAAPPGPGGQRGWYVWFGDAPVEAGGPGGAGAPGAGQGGEMGPGGAGGPGPGPPPAPVPLFTQFETEEANFDLGTFAFVALWAGPTGHNYLTPAWMLPGLDLGPRVVHPVRPGQGVLWSVGPDEVDNGGVRIDSVSPLTVNAGKDLVFIVPDFVRGGNP